MINLLNNFFNLYFFQGFDLCLFLEESQGFYFKSLSTFLIFFVWNVLSRLLFYLGSRSWLPAAFSAAASADFVVFRPAKNRDRPA